MSADDRKILDRNPVLRFAVAFIAIVVAIGVSAVVLLVVLPMVGIVVTAVLLVVAFILLTVAIAVPLIVLGALVLRGVLPAGWIGQPTVRGNGVLKSEMRDVRDFQAIKFSGAVRAGVVCGQDESLTVRGDENLLRHIETEVRDSVLHIRTTANVRSKTELRVDVAARAVERVDVSGACRVSVSEIDAEDFAAKGSGAVHLALSGRADSSHVEMSGASKLDAKELRCREVDAKFSDACKGEVFASEVLSADINGAGKLDCYGQPGRVNRHVSGAGKIHLK